jgi:hypothetical protein
MLTHFPLFRYARKNNMACNAKTEKEYTALASTGFLSFSFNPVRQKPTQNINLKKAFIPFKRLSLKPHPFCRLLFPALAICCSLTAPAQQITGVWKGKINSRQAELKLIKSGDSLVGTSCYYISKNNFRRYSVKGYFDQETNAVIWWDDILLEDRLSKGLLGAASPGALLTVADFNCPGEDKMMLDGNSSLKDDRENRGPVQLQKINSTAFPDAWDWVINNYTAGANDPVVIDSVSRLVSGPQFFPEERLPPVQVTAATSVLQPQHPAANIPLSKDEKTTTVKPPSTNEQKFAQRQKNLQLVVPVTSSGIELRFYDNAAIDGDSIAIFLNGRLLREHILLGGDPQTIRISADDLQNDNELVMVAENLGSIPPNTAYLVAVVGKKQYEARLFADEGSSALVRFIKKTGR